MIQEALGHLGVVSGAPFLPIFTIQMALPSWDKPNLVKISKIFWLFDDLYDEFYDEDNLVFVAKDFYLFQLNYFWMPLTEILQIILFVLLRDGHERELVFEPYLLENHKDKLTLYIGLPLNEVK